MALLARVLIVGISLLLTLYDARGICDIETLFHSASRLDGSVFTFFRDSNLHDCAALCVMHAICKSFSFDTMDMVCYLNYWSIADVVILVTDQNFITSDISLWPKTIAGNCSDHTCRESARCVVTRTQTDCVRVEFRRTSHLEGKYYHITHRRESWDSALGICEKRGGHLAIMNDQQENEFIIDILKACGLPSSLIWFGANDKVTEDDWYWVDGSPVDPFGWMIGQPNNPGEQDCAGIIANSGWKSNPCSYDYRFICELYK